MEAYSTSYNRRVGAVGKYPVIDLFPYKIQEVQKFNVRKRHYDYLPYNKESVQHRAYVADVWRKMVEGMWVEDGDTQVFMLPNLYYHINLGSLSLEDEDKNRFIETPTLRDNEWIIHTYIICCDGFSGFEDDDEFTCNIFVKAIEEGKEVPTKVMARLEATCRRPDGQWKRYIYAWDYLTWFYTIEQKKRHKNLGRPLYQNPSYNGCLLSSRRVAKTFNLSADCARNFLCNGVKRADRLKRNPQINMFVGATDSLFLNSFLKAAEESLRNMPGSEKGGKSPFFREFVGPWTDDRDPIIQGYRTPGSGGEVVGSRSMISKAALLPGKKIPLVSKRFLRIYEDEGGQDAHAQQNMRAGDASVKGDRGPSGSYFISGTGGVIKAIAQMRGIMTSPRQFRVFVVPNYWGAGEDSGLFIPATYAYADYKDANGNTLLMEATQYVVDQRREQSGGDDNKITDLRANEPLIPPEMYLSGGGSRFNLDVIQDRIDILEAGLFRKKAKVYELTLGKNLPKFGKEVIARVVEDRWHNVIDSMDYYNGDRKKTGELVVFEAPIYDGDEIDVVNSMYKVVYDPHQDLPSGDSFASIKVYKGMPRHRAFDKNEEFFNIVATFKGRLNEDDEHKLFMMLCLWYRCRGQYERNVSGIRGYFRGHNLTWLLQEPPINTIKEISPTTTQRQTSGIYMADNAVSGGLKSRATKMFVEWHNSEIFIDENGRHFIQIEICNDLSLLYEMTGYNETDNFDDISAMRVLMLWLKEENTPDEDKDEDNKSDLEDDDFKQLSRVAYELVNL